MSVNLPAVISEVSKVLRSEDVQRQVQTLLPPSISRDRFTEVTIAAIQNNPDVLEADRDSLYRACLASARRGLLPDKKEGALVIYNTKVSTNPDRYMKMVQFLPMVEGIIKEMAKAGISAYAVSVYENDTISFWNDDEGQHVRHEPQVFGDRGQIVGFYAAAKTGDGRPYVEAMGMQDVGQVARRSKQCSVNKQTGEIIYGGTWKTDFDRMGQKSCLHRLRKRLPITDEEALENLKDMEESSDIELNGVKSGSSSVPDSPVAQPEPATPPPAQLEAPKQSPADEVLKKPLRTPRRSRVLEGVVQNAKAGTAPTSGNPGAVPDPRPSPQPLPQPAQEEPEYGEDDIV